MSIAPPMMMSADALRASLPFSALVPALRDAFARGATVPTRHHHTIAGQGTKEATLLLMPAWQESGYLGVKIATIHPDNGSRGLPGVFATYILCDLETGRPLAVIDGSELTARRTAAVSALGADFLARPDARSLLVVGAGRVAALLPSAFATVRPIERVAVWNVRAEKAERLAATFHEQGFDARPVTSLAAAVAEADIVSCATLATKPLIAGEWLRPGTHLDLVGSFTRAMREADDACLAAAHLFVDTWAALEESGDLVDPIARGVIGADAVVGALDDLCAGRVEGRGDAQSVTLFKAVGTALADLGAAAIAYRSLVSRKG